MKNGIECYEFGRHYLQLQIMFTIQQFKECSNVQILILQEYKTHLDTLGKYIK